MLGKQCAGQSSTLRQMTSTLTAEHREVVSISVLVPRQARILQGPQMIILVPSMELGVQEAMLIYKLFGGSVNPGIPGASANMFAYSGPRGLKVFFLFDVPLTASSARYKILRP